MTRREFTKAVYLEIVKRAMLESGEIACEGCGLVLGKKRYHVDHTVPDALQIDKSRKLTADEGKLLGVECCHKPKTVIDQGVIAKAKRVEGSYLGAQAPKQKIVSRGFPQRAKPNPPSKQSLPFRPLYAPITTEENSR